MTRVEVTMPRLSDSMEEGTVARWLVALGDEVEKGQALVEIDTDKATVVYEAEAPGRLLEILVADGEAAGVGHPIARLETPGGAEEAVTTSPAPATRQGRRAGNVSPVARRLAAERGLDLAALTGSGPGGMITREDVERAGVEDSTPQQRTVQELTRVQRTVARRMVEGASAPTFSVEVEIDVTAAVELRGSLATDRGSAPSLNDLVVKAASVALREFPRLNGSYTDDGFELHDHVNVGIAVATRDELYVPVIREADRKPLATIAAETRELAAKVREGTISPGELEGGTFTVTNLGMLGVRRFVPILNPPQAAILSVGAATRRPVIDDNGQVAARVLASVTLVCDHRIAYGAEAAEYLARVRELLGQPEQLVRES